MSKNELWVLEWHQESNSIHVQPIDWVTAGNYAHFRGNSVPPRRYVPIFFGTWDEVVAEAEHIRPVLLEREAGK